MTHLKAIYFNSNESVRCISITPMCIDLTHYTNKMLRIQQQLPFDVFYGTLIHNTVSPPATHIAWPAMIFRNILGISVCFNDNAFSTYCTSENNLTYNRCPPLILLFENNNRKDMYKKIIYM